VDGRKAVQMTALWWVRNDAYCPQHTSVITPFRIGNYNLAKPVKKYSYILTKNIPMWPK